MRKEGSVARGVKVGEAVTVREASASGGVGRKATKLGVLLSDAIAVGVPNCEVGVDDPAIDGSAAARYRADPIVNAITHADDRMRRRIDGS